jgi:hypothetical protein
MSEIIQVEEVGTPSTPSATKWKQYFKAAGMFFTDSSGVEQQVASTDYVNSTVEGLWDDRGNFDASVDTYPSTGGSGIAGAVKKGDVWTISIVATSGDLLNYSIGSTVRALTDSPAQTASNWALSSGGSFASQKDVSNGLAGLTLFKINFKNVANTFTSFFTNVNTASRTYTFPDWDMTVAGLVSDFLVLKGTSSSGVKVGGATPRLGSADLRGHFTTESSGANAPVTATFDTGIDYLGYNQTDISRWDFHVEHRDVLGGTKKLHIHLKKARGSTVTAGTNLVITAICKHSYHHFDGQTPRGASPAPITVTFTITPAQLNAIPDGSTGIFEKEVFNAGGTGGLLNSNNLFIDDDITVQLTFTTVPTITGGATARLAMTHVDFHREVNDGSGTYNADDVAGSFYL